MCGIQSGHQVIKRLHRLKFFRVALIIRVGETRQLLVKIDVAEVSEALSLRVVVLSVLLIFHRLKWVDDLMQG